jgi:hypothetical protein
MADFSKLKTKGNIGVSAVWGMLQERPNAVFTVHFVRSKGGVPDKPIGEIVCREVRYGAATYEKAAPRVKGYGGVPKERKIARFDDTGAIPVHYVDSKEFRSILISHLLIFDGWKVK